MKFDYRKEVKTGVMYFEGERRSHKPRNIDGHQNLKTVRKWILPLEPPEGTSTTDGLMLVP